MMLSIAAVKHVDYVGDILDGNVADTIDVTMSSPKERHNVRELAPLLMDAVIF